MTPDELSRTRAGLHAVAELLLAGPQYRGTGTIRLTVDGNRIARLDGSVAIEAGDLVVRTGESIARYPIGGSIADLAAGAGIEPYAPTGLYHDTSGADPTTDLDVDPACMMQLISWYQRGRAALATIAPEETPVLWPEHLDLAITVDEVNYGVSPGDGAIPLPYAYVGPHVLPVGEFWDQPFGAARSWLELPDQESIGEFLRAGRDAVSGQARQN